jgi:hypothetical protein
MKRYEELLLPVSVVGSDAVIALLAVAMKSLLRSLTI